MPLSGTDMNGRASLGRGLLLRWDRLALILVALVLWALVVFGAGAFVVYGVQRFL